MAQSEDQMSEFAIRMISAAAGVLLWIILWIAGTGFVWALILGFVVAVVVWVVLHMMFDGRVTPIEQARPPERVVAPTPEPKPAPPADAAPGKSSAKPDAASPPAASEGEFEEEPADLPDLDREPSAADAQPEADTKPAKPSGTDGASAVEAKPQAGRRPVQASDDLPGQADLRGRKGELSHGSEAKGGAQPKKAAAASEDYPAEAGTQPQGLADAREGGADDLKKIKGVGPKLEQLLNTLGIYHFDQIAAWGPDEVAWMDGNLKGFKGRVSRDAWVDQAKSLAKG